MSDANANDSAPTETLTAEAVLQLQHVFAGQASSSEPGTEETPEPAPSPTEEEAWEPKWETVTHVAVYQDKDGKKLENVELSGVRTIIPRERVPEWNSLTLANGPEDHHLTLVFSMGTNVAVYKFTYPPEEERTGKDLSMGKLISCF